MRQPALHLALPALPPQNHVLSTQVNLKKGCLLSICYPNCLRLQGVGTVQDEHPRSLQQKKAMRS